MPRKTPREIHTYVENESGLYTRHHGQPGLQPAPRYNNPNEVPVPLRQMFRNAISSGLTAENLAQIYDLPLAWVELFVRDPGSTNH